MTTTRIQAMAMAVLTMITLAFVIMIPKITDHKINCSNPTTWSTAQGVEHCAVNGGK